MELISQLFANSEFWMAVSGVALVMPGPQTRLLPLLLKAVAQAVAVYQTDRKK
ncbi:MAG: hypothetical protein OEW12_06730 [Deltaproteobacteria bacterium]|nr:hypothetical protein [Deltaproteobacteria bacterium]